MTEEDRVLCSKKLVPRLQLLERIYLLGAIQGVLRPLDSGTRPLDDYPENIGIDMVTVHAQWLRDSTYQAYSSRGWSVGLWMFSAVPETYNAIETFQPKWITTGEAKTFSRWLAR